MKKLLIVMSLVACMGMCLVGCGDTKENNKNNPNQNNVSQNNAQQGITEKNEYVDLGKIDENKVVKTDLLTGEKLDYIDALTGLSADGKSFKLNDNVGEKELVGFEGTPKSVKYIHEENLEKSGTLAILNTNGEVYISNGGLFAPKIYMNKVMLEEEVKAIAVTSSYKNERGVVLMVTVEDELKAIDDQSMEVYKFVEEEEKKDMAVYEKIFKNGALWMPVFIINSKTNEKVYFEEPVSMYMFMDRERVNFEDNKNNTIKHGTYKINQETNNVEITYDDDSKETLVYVDNLGDNEGYLKITQADGLERYYRN